jgi:hypothetical protein
VKEEGGRRKEEGGRSLCQIINNNPSLMIKMN